MRESHKGFRHTEETKNKLRELSRAWIKLNGNPMQGRTGEDAPGWKGGPQEVECSNCGKKLKRNNYKVENQKWLFCNRLCEGAFKSKECRGENAPNWQGGPVTRICKVCSKEFQIPKSYLQDGPRNFCSNKCYGTWLSEHQRGENNPSWLGGISFEPYGVEFTDELKEQIRERDNYICQKCGKTEKEYIEEKGRVLSVHHIDYIKKHNSNNNLITLCNDCNLEVNKNRPQWTRYFTNMLTPIIQV